MTRRDARRAELWRRLDASCAAHRAAEPPSPPPAEAPREDQKLFDISPIRYWRHRYWKHLRSLTSVESNPTNSRLSPAEDSVCPPPEKRQLIVSDEDSEQCDDDAYQIVFREHASARVSLNGDAYQIDPYKFEEVDGGEHEQGTDHFSVPCKRPRQRSLSIAAYAVQCATCEKWRHIPTKQKYEELRAQIQTDPFECEKAREWKPDVTCNDPSDVSQDGGWLWAMDQHNIPQSPPGFERLIAVRNEGCTRFADVYYTTPTGKKLRSSKEVESYLKENPERAAQGVNLSQFSFKIPAPARRDYVRKRTNKTDQNDGSHKELSKPLLEEGEANRPDVLIALCRYPRLPILPVLPIAWSAPPTHEELGGNNQLVPYNEGPPGLLQPEPTETKLENPPPPPLAI